MTRELIMLCAITGVIGTLVAAGPLDDPSSGPAGGTTNVRPALPSTMTDGSQRLSRPAQVGAKPIQPSPLEFRPSSVPGVREIVVPGAQRTLPVPAALEPRSERVSSYCLSCHPGGVRPHDSGSRATRGSPSDRLRFDPRVTLDARQRSGSPAIDRSRELRGPGVDRRSQGFSVFPGSNSGPYWSERLNSGSDSHYPMLHLNNDGSVTVKYPAPSTNWFNTPVNPFGDGWNNPVVSDPQFPLPFDGVLPDPCAAPPLMIVPAAAPSTLDLADAKFAARDYAGAVLLYQQHVAAAPDDGWAMRAMAVSLFLSNRLPDGADAMARAYAIMPELADQPMPAAAFPRGAAEVRDAVGRASAFAEKARTDEAWLMAAVLLQSSGQPKGALKMVDRAVAAGLDPVVAAKMNAALAKP